MRICPPFTLLYCLISFKHANKNQTVSGGNKVICPQQCNISFEIWLPNNQISFSIPFENKKPSDAFREYGNVLWLVPVSHIHSSIIHATGSKEHGTELWVKYLQI